MQQNQASQTAEYMALFRALETARPAQQRLFNDPLAVHFLKPSLRLAAQLAHLPGIRNSLNWYIDWRWPGARTSGIARTRLIDDLLLAGIKSGIEQVVILGAGYDSRAYRLEGLKTARVFEVDYPATLAAKRQIIAKHFGKLPEQVTYLEIDFNQQSLDEVMSTSEFDLAKPTFFIWEGVTNYLTAEAVDSTLRFISTAASSSQLAFTYIHQGVLDGSFKFEGVEELTLLLREAHEVWTFGFDPATLPDYLTERQLELLQDKGSVEYRAAYLGNQKKNLRGYEFYRVALAQVSPVKKLQTDYNVVVYGVN